MAIKATTYFILSILLFVSISCRAKPAEDATAYIIYTDQPQSAEPKAFHIKTLSAVLGSEEAAKEALLYSYTNMGGFAAKLTPAQAIEMSKQPGVVQVVQSRTLQLMQTGPEKPSV